MARINSLVYLLSTVLVAFAIGAQSQDQKTCVVESSNAESDDSIAFSKILNDCNSNAVIEFKEGTDYNIWSPVSAKLSNVEIRVNGNLHLPKSIQQIQDKSRKRSSWFQLSGFNVHWIGSRKEKYGWIDSYGQQWYDANPPGKTGMPNRPHLFRWSVNNGSLRFFKSRKPIGWNVGISGNHNYVSDAIIDAVSDSSFFPFNTDAFGVSGRNITIRNSHIMNGDDALAVGNGAHNVLFENNIIGYQTHGMSIGSLGANPNSPADVSNIVFRNITVKGGLYAARFKSWKGGKGLVSNVTWSDIRVENVKFPIFVTQTYQNQAAAKQERTGGQAVVMRNFTWEKFSGTINSQSPGDGSCVKPCWYYEGLAGLKHTEAVILGCDSATSCQNFVLRDVDLKPMGDGQATQLCVNAQPESNPKLGIECKNGNFKPV